VESPGNGTHHILAAHTIAHILPATLIDLMSPLMEVTNNAVVVEIENLPFNRRNGTR